MFLFLMFFLKGLIFAWKLNFSWHVGEVGLFLLGTLCIQLLGSIVGGREKGGDDHDKFVC